MTKTTTETTMTEVDMIFQVAANRIQGLTAKVNHWKQRADKLEADLGVEKAARLVPPTHYDELQEELQKERSAHAESCRYLAEAEAKVREWGTENKRFRTEIIPELEKQRDGLTTQVQDMRNEIARLRADLRTMSERSNGSEWEQKAVEIEELRAELNLVKQERDCAKSEWDRAEGRCKTFGGEVAELFSDRQRLKAELAVIKDERNELRAKLEASEAESRCYYKELSQIRRNALPGEPNATTPRSHPVKVGEWVKLAGKKSKVVSVGAAGYSLDGQRHCLFSDCTPCDPPEATEQMMLRRERVFAVKEAAANALEDSDPVRKIQREPKPGDTVRLVRVPTPGPDFDGFIDFPWNTDWGAVGDVAPVVATLAPPNLPVIAVHVPSGLVVWWPLSCIEIVDAK